MKRSRQVLNQCLQNFDQLRHLSDQRPHRVDQSTQVRRGLILVVILVGLVLIIVLVVSRVGLVLIVVLVWPIPIHLIVPIVIRLGGLSGGLGPHTGPDGFGKVHGQTPAPDPSHHGPKIGPIGRHLSNLVPPYSPTIWQNEDMTATTIATREQILSRPQAEIRRVGQRILRFSLGIVGL